MLKYQLDNNKSMKGMRVKLTFTFSGGGTSAPQFITVTGMTKRELPEDTSLLFKVKGLCIGGGGINVGCDGVGYILFIRKKENCDMVWYSYYQKEVLIPFNQRSRKDFDWFVNSTPIPDKLTASSWCDGDIKQVQSIVSDVNFLNSLKTIASKHNAA